MDQPERDIISACQTGDLARFGELYERYLDRVYRFLYYKTFHRETAEDLTSHTFLKALEHIRAYDPAKGELASWLYRIAQNTFIDHYRARKPALDIDSVFSLASGEDVARDVSLREQLAKVEQYLGKLKPEQRELVLMRVWQGLTYQEIAEATGKSEAALKMAFSRALRELRIQLPLAVLLFWLSLSR